eukprot:gene19789-20270_t
MHISAKPDAATTFLSERLGIPMFGCVRQYLSEFGTLRMACALLVNHLVIFTGRDPTSPGAMAGAVTTMKHQATRELYGYWQRLRRGRSAPDRSEIEPADIRNLLGYTFILEVVSPREYRFRLAGTRLCALYGREMKGKDFATFWQGKDRDAVATILSAISEDAAASVIGFLGTTDHNRDLPLECLMLPLRQHGEGYTRVIGSLVPMDDPYWIGIHPIMAQSVTSLRLIWPDERPSGLIHSADLAPSDSPAHPLHVTRSPNDFRRKVQHLTVYEGGKN